MYNLPKKYISYSAYDLWNKDKNRFRQKYYEGIDNFETAETLFGKKIAKILEEGGNIPGVIKPEKTEYRIEVHLNDDIKLMGYLDGFNESDLSIIEYKTGHCDREGKEPWNSVKVHKHKQLIWYCLMVLIKFERYNPLVTLQWLETYFKKDTREFNGITLEAQTRDLNLTGRVETFTKEVEQWEIDKLKENIIKTVKDISEDYTLWQKKNQN